MLILEYVDPSGRRPFRSWFDALDRAAALKVDVALRRLEQGNISNVKSVGAGIYEFRIDFGPGYRLYLAYDGISSSYFWREVPRSARARTSLPPGQDGLNIRAARAQEFRSHGTSSTCS